MIDEARCLLFDLDGTLYEDTDHFRYYADRLKEGLDESNRSLFEKDYASILNGEHPLQIGKVYDAEYDLILTVNPFTNEVENVQDWTGEEVENNYNARVDYDFERKVAIGDGWWIPSSIARHYGIKLEEAFECYRQTKEFMASDQFTMTQTPGLRKALEAWRKDKALLLVTNSEEEDVAVILEQLNLEGVFHEIITSAQKPMNVIDQFEGLLKKYELLPEESVSIGDNFMNEIAPALVLGMKAIFVQPHSESTSHENMIHVHSLKEIT
ncbi:HAD family hydrolase [Halobacillus litoralis]|uniref:HAD family hydrolase n=1 Tax=Halobacillus litoralis TaxID=45668 RepID=UPI001CD24DCC|nr:HAD family hydrolase [Halobacillus litoralis]MCA0969612.1 HAD family hydrolase [Halobacillus litoralis]